MNPTIRNLPRITVSVQKLLSESSRHATPANQVTIDRINCVFVGRLTQLLARVIVDFFKSISAGELPNVICHFNAFPQLFVNILKTTPLNTRSCSPLSGKLGNTMSRFIQVRKQILKNSPDDIGNCQAGR